VGSKEKFNLKYLIAANGIKLKADRLYKRFGDGGLILGCVSCVRWIVCKPVCFI
jgi:hypothetical protein